MSQNGERLVLYKGYYQTDVIRDKALSHIESHTSSDERSYTHITPAAPPTTGDGAAVPCFRHMRKFTNATDLRVPSSNPQD
ncbi:hypothetical protein ACHAP8_012293 [Fusarium lateritium]